MGNTSSCSPVAPSSYRGLRYAHPGQRKLKIEQKTLRDIPMSSLEI